MEQERGVKPLVVVILLGGCLLALVATFALMREFGGPRLERYTATFHHAGGGMSIKSHGLLPDPDAGYSVVFSYRGNEVRRWSEVGNATPPLEIKAEFEPRTWSGDYVRPLKKSFQLDWICKFTSASGEASLEGELRGRAPVDIKGPCTRTHAKEMVIQYAIDDAQRRLKQSLESRGPGGRFAPRGPWVRGASLPFHIPRNETDFRRRMKRMHYAGRPAGATVTGASGWQQHLQLDETAFRSMRFPGDPRPRPTQTPP